MLLILDVPTAADVDRKWEESSCSRFEGLFAAEQQRPHMYTHPEGPGPGPGWPRHHRIQRLFNTFGGDDDRGRVTDTNIATG